VNAGENHARNEKRDDWELGAGGCLCRAHDSFRLRKFRNATYITVGKRISTAVLEIYWRCSKTDLDVFYMSNLGRAKNMYSLLLMYV
jgi:hypothetical protein